MVAIAALLCLLELIEITDFMENAETQIIEIAARISPHTPAETCTTPEGVAWLVERHKAATAALYKLEEIRADKLAAAGMGPEATALSAARHLLRHNDERIRAATKS